MKRITLILSALWLGRLSAATLQHGEWFINEDPGVGSGIAFAVSGSGASVAVPASALQPLAPGVHLLGVRLRDDDGDWGHTVWRPFLKDEPVTLSPTLAALEYRLFRDGQLVSTHSVAFDRTANPSSARMIHGKQNLLLGATHELQLFAIDSAGQFSHAKQATFTYQAYVDAWLLTHFTAQERSNPAISGDDEDPDLDGLSNAEERAFALNPRDPGDSAQAFTRISREANGLKLGFRVPAGGSVGADGIYQVSNLQYQVLQGQTPDASLATPVNWMEAWTLTPLDRGAAKLEFQLNPPPASSRFFRLRGTE